MPPLQIIEELREVKKRIEIHITKKDESHHAIIFLLDKILKKLD